MKTNSVNEVCELCKDPIPDTIRAKSNRKYCPTCFSIVTRQGVTEAMRIRGKVQGDVSDAIQEADIRNLAAGLMSPEDFADLLENKDSDVVSSIYNKSNFSNPAKKESILNILGRWVIDMKPTAIDMEYIRCCECGKGKLAQDRLAIDLSQDEAKHINHPKQKLMICNDCHAKVRASFSEGEVKSPKGSINFNNLSLSQAIVLGGLNPYDTPQWVINNPNCWKYIHPAQEDKFVGKLDINGMIFLGNGVALTGQE